MQFKSLVKLLFVSLIFQSSVYAQELPLLIKVKQIVPLYSTESDVERIYGKPVEQYADVKHYNTEVGRLKVTYSDGNCNSNGRQDYQVEKGKVIYVELDLDQTIKMKSLGQNLNGFKKLSDRDASGVYIYENKDSGLRISTYEGELSTLYLFPANKYSYLMCQILAENGLQKDPIKEKITEWFTKIGQLQLLHSSREQVRHLFGKPGTPDFENIDKFTDNIAVISFAYSTGACSLKNLDNWNVPEGTLLSVNIFFLERADVNLFDDYVANSIKSPKYQTLFKSYDRYKIEYRAENNKILIAKILPLDKEANLLCEK